MGLIIEQSQNHPRKKPAFIEQAFSAQVLLGDDVRSVIYVEQWAFGPVLLA
jgi:hypothetical protein